MKRTTPTLVLTLLVAIAGCAPAAMAPTAPGAPAAANAKAGVTRPPLRPMPAATPTPAPAPKFVAAKRRPAVFMGHAYLGAPVVDATVTMYDQAGKVVGTPFKTGAGGGFTGSTAGLPDYVELRTSGGTVDGKPLAGELRGVLRLDEADGEVTSLGVMSTLEAAYLRHDPSAFRAKALDRVEAYLGLPGHAGGTRDEELVDARPILAAATSGLTAYLDGMAKEMLADPASVRPAVQHARRLGVEGSLAGWVATNVGAGALSQVGSAGAGSVIRALAGGDPANAQVVGALKDLSASVDALKTEVDNIASQIEVANYKLSYSKIEDYVGTCKSVILHETNLASYRKTMDDPASTASQKVEAAKNVKNALDLLDKDMKDIDEADLETWHDAMMTETVPGLIQTYSQHVAHSSPFYGKDEALRMQTWWDRLDGMRAVLVLHMIEMQSKADPDVTPEFIKDNFIDPWLKHRREEFGQLRGLAKPTDVLVFNAPSIQREENALNWVPEAYVYQRYASLLWSARGVISHYAPYRAPDAADVAAQNQSMAIYGRPPYMWRVPFTDEVEAFLDWKKDRNFVANRLQGRPFRSFAGMGVVAQAHPGEGARKFDCSHGCDGPAMVRDFGGGVGFWDGRSDSLLPNVAIYIDGMDSYWDYTMAANGLSDANVTYYVSAYDPQAEPHWYE